MPYDQDVTSNARQIADRYRRRGQAVRTRLAQNAQAEGQLLVAEGERIMQAEIYAVPVPVSSTGRPKWERTRELLGSERFRVEGEDRATVILYNQSRHSGPRSRLGTSKGRPIRSPGIRSVQWQEKAVQRNRARLLRMKQAALRRALEAP